MTHFTLYDKVTLTKVGLDKILLPFNGEDIPFPIPEEVFTVISMRMTDLSLRGFVPLGEEHVELEITDYDSSECEELRDYAGIIGYTIKSEENEFYVKREDIVIINNGENHGK